VVCAISNGNLFWQAFGHNRHLSNASHPVAYYKTSSAAKRYATRHANEHSEGLCVVDTRLELVDWGAEEKLVWENPFAPEED
jgi:hypothetical protein